MTAAASATEPIRLSRTGRNVAAMLLIINLVLFATGGLMIGLFIDDCRAVRSFAASPNDGEASAPTERPADRTREANP